MPHAPSPSNRLGLNYRDAAMALGPPPVRIIDVHTHLRGAHATRIYQDAAQHFGVSHTWSMTPLADVDTVRSVLGNTVSFIAVPNFRDDAFAHAMGPGFLEAIGAFHARGARIVKFWSAPRATTMAREAGCDDLMSLDGPWRQRQMRAACDLGMSIMTHVADPDTWFATRYTDRAAYGSKADQYAPLERALRAFPVPWIAAHMGGWPEDLDRLDALLDRHPNLYFDTSATKWMVRELSRHDRGALIAFLTRWSGRILFGSDIVAQEEHVSDASDGRGRSDQAASEREAFDLYASRYWALRTLLETEWSGESPIADPDLERVDPDRFGPMDAPPLIGKSVPPELLTTLYRGAAEAFTQGPVAG
ncbi:MAG: amidohydrolase family protein [Phycisphaerales bacterium]|nr:amidohydrolase family protein [Phycisphaerales bacterium]